MPGPGARLCRGDRLPATSANSPVSRNRDLCPACQSFPVHPQFPRETFGGSMSSLRNCQFGATLAVALTLSLLPTRGHAYTAEEQQACQPDAFRLCSSELTDVDRVTACMV